LEPTDAEALADEFMRLVGVDGEVLSGLERVTGLEPSRENRFKGHVAVLCSALADLT
jgi:hypothetical protein